jgi:hypothetical protein
MASMGSGNNSQSRLDSSSSLELALDRAIAQRWATEQERPARKRRLSPYPASLGLNYTPTPKLSPPTSAALTVPSQDTALAVVPRLRWRGIEVSEEFQAYAARVERGEELAPYRGPVLSRACAEFPWSAVAPAPMLPPPATMLPPPAPLPVYPERGRGLKTALWVTTALASIVGALGVGAGAASVPGNEIDANVQSTALALKPVPAAPVAAIAPIAPVSEALASLDDIERIDDAELPSTSVPARQRAPLAASTRPAPTRPALARPVIAKPIGASIATATATPEPASPLAPPTLAEILASPGRRVSSASSASTAPSSMLPNVERTEPTQVATGTEAAAEATPGRDSTLFSDQSPF